MDLNKDFSMKAGSICLDSCASKKETDKTLANVNDKDFMISDDSGNIPDIDEDFSRKKHKPRKPTKHSHLKISDDLYSYDELLSLLRKAESLRLSETGQKKEKIIVPPPITLRISSVKSALVNFQEICVALHREPRMLIKFIMVEFGTSASVDKNNWLILRGIFKTHHFTSVIKNFIKSYVKCWACKGFETVLSRHSRKLYVACKYCEAETNVEPIADLFKARTGIPGERRDN